MNDLKHDIHVLAEAILCNAFTDYDQLLLMDVLFEKALRLWRKPFPLLYTYVVADKLFSLSSFKVIHRVFGSKPIQNPKTVALALRSFVYLTKAGMPQFFQSAINAAHTLASHLIEFGPDCRYADSPFRHWYDFTRNLYYPRSSPNIYLTALYGKALLSVSELDSSFLARATEIANFLLLPQCYTEWKNRVFYKYFVGDETLLVHNANTAAGSFLIQLSRHVTDGSRYSRIGRSALKSTVEEIGENGRLSYFSKTDVRYSPRMTDNFHTGFVICDLIDALDDSLDEAYYNPIRSLLRFYSTMFDRSGCPSSSPWRRYPVDIHDFAVGILTFSEASCLNEKLLCTAYKIYGRAKKSLQDDDGLYFYQYYPLFRHKGKFLRWNQAWMLVALSALISRIAATTKILPWNKTDAHGVLDRSRRRQRCYPT